MTSTFTVKQAARIANCHKSTIGKLCRDGTFKTTRVGGRGGYSYRIEATPEELRTVVQTRAPRSGFVTQRPPANGSVVSMSAPTVSPSVADLLAFARFPAEVRTLLIGLGEKFKAEDLAALVTL